MIFAGDLQEVFAGGVPRKYCERLLGEIFAGDL